MTLHGAGPDTHELGGVANGSPSGDKRRERLDLTLRRLRREGAAQVPGLMRFAPSPGGTPSACG